jgi:hypothetical protein
MDIIKTILMLFPVMIFYLVEAMFSAIFVNLAWRFILQPKFGIEITYFDWVAIIWIIKILLFDVFKMLNGVNIINNPTNRENDEIQ